VNKQGGLILSDELIIYRDELQLLLNHLGPKIEVDYPPTNLQLFDAELDVDSYELQLYFDPDSFGTPFLSNVWQSEQPRYYDVLQCFLASGLLTYPNLEQLVQQINVLRNISRKSVFCPDTNIFYNNFFSSTKLLKPEELVFVDLCQKEMIASLNYKLTSRDISKIKAEIKYQPKLYDELINRKNKTSRLANLALYEYNRYADSVYHIIKADNPTSEKERNDILFVEAVSNYLSDSRTYPVILTCDQILIDVCEAYGIEYFLLELPKTILPGLAKPSQLVGLLANLSGVLGFIKVGNVILYGEFRGKGRPDECKIKFLSGEIPLSLDKDLEICRNLLKLEISR